MFESRSPRSLPHHLNWRTIPVPRTHPLCGWIAGPPIGVWTHHGGAVSKPCWRRITGGTLKCPMCSTAKLRWIAYLPLLTNRAQDRRVIIISRSIFPDVEKLNCWTHVQCLCPQQRGMPSVVRSIEDQGHDDTTTKRLKKRSPEDIREYLLTVLWHVPELCDHFGCTPWTPE